MPVPTCCGIQGWQLKEAVTTKERHASIRMHNARSAPPAWCEGIAAAVQEMMDEATQLAHSNTAKF
jgi:hypothetical protein